MIFNIYIANHGKKVGIEDFVAILEGIIRRHGHEVTITESLDRKAVNFVIDEFTNYLFNNDIAEFKRRYPETMLIYVLTEFVEWRLCVRSFNFYGGVLDAAAIAAMNVYFRYRREDFLPPTLRDWLVAVLYAPLLPFYVLSHLGKNLFGGGRLTNSRKRLSLVGRLHRLAYMLMRYQGLEKMIAHADCLILAHPLIARNLEKMIGDTPVLGTIHPEIDFEDIKNSLFHEKQLSIEITGSMTPYRKKVISRINLNLLALGLHAQFQSCKPISFSLCLDADAERGAYSLHPPQTRNWKYSSPTRIYRALQYDHNMPVLTKVFNQHPIEKLCLEFRGYKKTFADMYLYYKYPECLIERLEPLAREYMDIATKENDAILKMIVKRSERVN